MTEYMDNYGNKLSPEEVYNIVDEVLRTVIEKMEQHINDGDGEYIEIDNVGYYLPDNIRFFKRARRFIGDMYGLVEEWIIPEEWVIHDDSSQ